MIRFFKLGLAVVLSLTLAAPPAAAQGDEGAFGWYILGIIILGIAAFIGSATLIAVGLDRAVPDPPVALAEEHVKINLAPDVVSVSAVCVFENTTDEDQTLELSYPFGRGRGVGPAANVAVTDGAGQEIQFTRENGNIKFAVAVPAKSRLKVVINYKQPVSGTIFKYLLGKDRRWGLAGAYTTFLVTAPAAVGKVTSVYPLDKVAEEGEYTSYVYISDKFYPNANFTITWKKPPPATP